MVAITRPRLAAPDADSNKYARGKVVVVAGAMPGAALLAAGGAQRSGAGYVVLLGDAPPGPPHALVRLRWSIDAIGDPRNGAVVIGPGLGDDRDSADRLEVALAAPHPLVIDAGALALLGRAGGARRLATRAAPTILTPHEGEFARLFGRRGGTREARTIAASATSGAIVLLKGSRTIVADRDGRTAIADAASPWLASAGTGDVLAGILGTMLAQGLPAFDAACAAVWLHGDAARRAGPVLIADDLVTQLPATVADCLA